MTELCLKVYHYFRSHRTVCWISMIAWFVCCGFFAAQIHLEEDINKLFPASTNEDGSTKLAFANLKIKDKTFLLFEGKDGASVAHIIETCDAFVDSLLQKEAALDSSSRMLEDIFYCLPDELLPDAIDYLGAHLPAYIDTSFYAAIDTMLTDSHLARQMKVNRQELESSWGSIYPELIQIDPLGLRKELMRQFKPLTEGSGSGYKIIDGHFFVPDSTVCVAFLTPRYSATNTGRGASLFQMLNAQIEAFSASNPDVKICYHGTPASGFYNAAQIKSDLKNTIAGALVLVLLFILFCFRNYDTLPLLLLPVLFGVLFGLTGMYFIKGEFSLLALGIGAVVLGVAFSYVLHILTHYKFVGNPEQVLRDQVRPVCLGCITTIGSFMGLVFVQTELLRDFGLFASLSILGTTAFSLFYLPQLLNPAKNRINKRAFSLIEKVNAYPFDRNKPLIAVLVVLTVVCTFFYFMGGTRFDADMHDLGYKAGITSYSENLLRTKTYTGDKQKYFASSGRTMEEAIHHFESLNNRLDSLQKEGLVKSYTRTGMLFVPLDVQQARIHAWKNFWTDQRLQCVRQLIEKTAPEAGLRPEAFQPFFESATADYKPDALYDAGIIPQGYLSTLMEQSYNGEYLCFTSVRCANDSVRSSQSDYHRICDAVASLPNLLALDTYYYTTDTLTQMSKDFNLLQWISMLFVFVILWLSFRGNIRYTLLGFMPILLSWFIVLGAMVIFGKQFNLVSVVISTFIFGIGVDYSIFVMSGLLEKGNNPDLLKYHKTAIFFSAVILIITVGSMMFARHPAISSVGFCTLVGLVSSVVLSYVLQPAIFRMMQERRPR